MNTDRPAKGRKYERIVAGGVAVALGVLFLLASAVCTGRDYDQSVSGEIVDVVPRSIDTFESLTIRDRSGEMWTFGPARMSHFTPSHLIEHQVNGDRITVFYRVGEDGNRVVVAIEDADGD